MLLAVLGAVALLAGACSSSSQSSGSTDETQARAALPPCPLDALANTNGPVEVVLWHFLQAKTRDALEEIATKYNASQSKVKVRVENQGTSNDELWKKYQAGVKAKDLPGIAVLDDTVTQQIVDSGTVLPAQSCIEADHYDMSDFLPTGQAYYTIDGVLYPSSLNLSGALLYYNKNHLRRAGLDPEKAPQTLEEVRQQARAIKAAGVVDKPVVLQVSPAIIEMFLTGAGAPIVNNDNGRGSGATDASAYDNETTVGFYRWVREMVDEGLMEALPQTPGQIGQYLSMANQKASMTIETSTAATSVEAFLKGDLNTRGLPEGIDAGAVDPQALDIGAAKVPGIKAPGRLAMGGGAWYITNTTKPEVQAAAWDFMKYFNSTESQVTWNLVGSYLPYRMSATKDAKVVDNWSNTLAGRWLAIAYDELLTGVDPKFPGPLIGPYDQVRQAMRKSVDEIIFNQGDPAKAVNQASTDITKLLQQYQQEG